MLPQIQFRPAPDQPKGHDAHAGQYHACQHRFDELNRVAAIGMHEDAVFGEDHEPDEDCGQGATQQQLHTAAGWWNQRWMSSRRNERGSGVGENGCPSNLVTTRTASNVARFTNLPPMSIRQTSLPRYLHRGFRRSDWRSSAVCSVRSISLYSAGSVFSGVGSLAIWLSHAARSVINDSSNLSAARITISSWMSRMEEAYKRDERGGRGF